MGGGWWNFCMTRLLPLQGVPLLSIFSPGCRHALPWAMCSLPFQGVLPRQSASGGRYNERSEWSIAGYILGAKRRGCARTEQYVQSGSVWRTLHRLGMCRIVFQTALGGETSPSPHILCYRCVCMGLLTASTRL